MARSIFITGAASGIGRATAELFAARGWRVGVADVNMAGARAVAGAIAGEAFDLDVRDRAAWAACLDAFTAPDGGGLDVLHNNAGIASGGPLAEASWALLDLTVEVNFRGVLNGARIGHAYLARRPGSCLLNTASASAIYGSAGLATYSATKFAVRALTEALDGEWAAQGIKVASLMPGFVSTPLVDGGIEGSNRTIRDTVTDAGLELIPAEDVARAAWDAVHGDRVHWVIGPTARRLSFAARWLPGRLRKMMRRGIA